MQVAILAGIGIKYNIKSFRLFAAVLTIAFFPSWFIDSQNSRDYVILGIRAFEHFKIGIVASIVFGLLNNLSRSSHKTAENNAVMFFDRFYLVAANLIAALCISSVTAITFQTPGWIAMGVTNSLLGLKRCDDVPFSIGIITLSWGLISSIYCMPNWETSALVCSITMLYCGYAFIRTALNHLNLNRIQFSRWVYSLSAHTLTSLLILTKCPADFVSLALGMQALCLITAGFLIKDGSFRVSALAVLFLLTGKLLFFDFAKFDTLERIISFIGAGMVFLVASFVYGKNNSVFSSKGSAPISWS